MVKKNPLDDIKKMDILSLKRQVIEEIKSEMELNRDNPSTFKQNQTKMLEQQKTDSKQMEQI